MLNKKTSKYLIDLNDFQNVHINPSFSLIKEEIISNNEGVVGLNGALMVDTGIFTGRSPKDKYFVEENFSKENLWWGPVNKKIDKNIFDKLYNKVVHYYKNDYKKTYVFEGFAGADTENQLNVRVIAKKAWQFMFCRNMFINSNHNKQDASFKPDFTIINASDINHPE